MNFILTSKCVDYWFLALMVAISFVAGVQPQRFSVQQEIAPERSKNDLLNPKLGTLQSKDIAQLIAN